MGFITLKQYFLNKQKHKQKNLEQHTTVFRLISEREKQAIEMHDISKLGCFYKKSICNNHKYKKNIKYIHFFDNKNDARLLHNELGSSKAYLCTCAIPINILKKYLGKGYYTMRGYYDTIDTIKEYAIPTSDFDFEWIKSITPIKDFLKE